MTDEFHAGKRVEYHNPNWVGQIDGEGTVLPLDVAAAGDTMKPDDWEIKVPVLWDDSIGLTWEYPEHLRSVTAVRASRYALWMMSPQDRLYHLQAIHPNREMVIDHLRKVPRDEWSFVWISEVWAETNVPLATPNPDEFGENLRWQITQEIENDD